MRDRGFAEQADEWSHKAGNTFRNEAVKVCVCVGWGGGASKVAVDTLCQLQLHAAEADG